MRKVISLRMPLSMLLLALSSVSYAETRLALDMGLHFGGDELAEVFISDGYYYQYEESIDAGELLSLSIGAEIDLTEIITLQATIGYKIDSVSGDNADVHFERFPLNVMVFSNNGPWRYGGGLTYHLDPSFETSGDLAQPDIAFDDAVGFVAEVDYFLTENFFIGGRVTIIDYDFVNSTVSADGDSIGLVLGGVL